MQTPSVRFLTYNVGMPLVKVLGKVVEPVPFVEERFAKLPCMVRSTRADVILLQELFSAEQAEVLTTVLRDDYPFSYGHDDGGPLWLSNGLLCLSKFPIVRQQFVAYREEAWEERLFMSKGFQSMDIQAPGMMFSVLNTHLTAGGFFGHPERLKYDEIREAQIEQILQHVRRFRAGLAIGDFNAGPQASPDNYFQLTTGLYDAYVQAWQRSGPEVTWDPQNPLNIGGPHMTSPPQRIDLVLYNDGLRERMRPTQVSTLGLSMQVPTSKGTVPVSDHWGVLADFIMVLENCLPAWFHSTLNVEPSGFFYFLLY